MPLLYLLAIALGTAALWLPVSRAGDLGAPLSTAVFTSVSAVAVTGLIVEDTPVYWSMFGQIVILVLIQIGGLGTKTAATFFALSVGRGFVLRRTVEREVEREQLSLSDASFAIKLILLITLVVEAVATSILTYRFHVQYSMPLDEAFWHGLFQAVSAFNNAGFSTFSDSLMGFSADAAVLLPIIVAVIIGSLGFPVLQDIIKCGRNPSDWTLHSRITLIGTAVLLLLGFLVILITESGNINTLGPMGWGERALNAFMHSAMPRTAGFNSLDVGAFRDETVLFNYVLMFIGGGSAGTAGGIKITTIAVLFAILVYQIRGLGAAEMSGRRISNRLASQAVTVIMFALTAIFVATFYLSVRTPHSLTDIMFETISAFATVGLSRGITGDLPVDGQMVLVALMFIGRVGTITAATWLAMGAVGRGSPRRDPAQDPIIG
ncbi:TrkH family potassium uptake protein [Erythrobacter insulae]|uniref:TrkH family potassium uptake protein n=1 Tax=Erythrobacter insulae TaxID=2584124 RepID=UPI001F3A6BA0|nr:potassium transporter TrkG [Erythrobacter insulae]